LAHADVFYRSGDAGLPYLPWRARFAVATARRVYSAIGQRLLARQADVTAPRAVVPSSHKLWFAARALLDALPKASSATPQLPSPSSRPLRFPEDVLPI
jgi:phytoene synthase